MNISPEIQKMLCCPRCQSDLDLGSVHYCCQSETCAAEYPIIDYFQEVGFISSLLIEKIRPYGVEQVTVTLEVTATFGKSRQVRNA